MESHLKGVQVCLRGWSLPGRVESAWEGAESAEGWSLSECGASRGRGG